MPIDRPDGRHFCDPASETPDEHGSWTCPCGNTWVLYEGVWVLEEDLEATKTAFAVMTEDVPATDEQASD